MPKIKLEDAEYDVEELSPGQLEYINKLKQIQNSLQERKYTLAIFAKAKKAYIDELKSEILSAKSGIDFD